MKRVLVTGGGGYIGSCVVNHLLNQGLEVRIVDKFLFGGEGLIALLHNPRCDVWHGDIRDTPLMRKALLAIDAVVHLAALVGDKACDVDPTATEEINVNATRSLLHDAEKAGASRFILISTCSNYGVSEPNVLADEGTPLRPLSLYARTKIKAEQIALMQSSSELDTIVYRFGTVCGLSPRMRFNLLVNEMARAAALKKKIGIFSPESWRPYLHIRDACRAIHRGLTTRTSTAEPRVYNIVGQNLQKIELVNIVRKHYPTTPIEITPAATDLRDYRVSSKRAEHELSFHAKETVETAFREVAQAVDRSFFVNPLRNVYDKNPEPCALKCA